ncbi:nucleotidyltransferase family protein [Paenibacillus sp. GCM10027629]|uniref:nucleotidyltransferase family protein n=1 Tax=Paenibacillus sp. GCM10027629 TaxID=3273414 RepID=UPI0036275401
MNHSRIHGIYLAAGQSTRMGSDKLRLPLGSMCLGNYALAAALNSCLDYIWIISSDARPDWMDRSFFEDPIHRKWSVISCPEAHLGQAASLRCGIQAANSMKATAVMILLADQPLITKELINELLGHYETGLQHNIHYAAASFEGLARPPVLFDHRKFADLMQLQGDQGARSLIRKDPSGICIDFKMPDLFMDVDTPEDYQLLLDKMGL